MTTDSLTERPGIVSRVIVAIAFGALYTYPLWSAVGNVFNIAGYYSEKFGAGVESVPWIIVVAGVVLPLAIYVLGTLVTWRRGAGAMALVLTTGFAVVSATNLSLLAFEKEVELRLVIDFLLKG